MGCCLSFSKKYNKLHKQTDNPVNHDINETKTIKFIENYIGNENSISENVETPNRLDNLIEYLENTDNSIYGTCESETETENNSNINEISVKSHTFIITRSDSDIDKIDRRYTL